MAKINGGETDPQLLALGRRVRDLRRLLNWTQDALIEKSGLGDMTIKRLESGAQAPNWATLTRLREVLGVNFGQLLGDEEIDSATKLRVAIRGFEDRLTSLADDILAPLPAGQVPNVQAMPTSFADAVDVQPSEDRGILGVGSKPDGSAGLDSPTQPEGGHPPPKRAKQRS